MWRLETTPRDWSGADPDLGKALHIENPRSISKIFSNLKNFTVILKDFLHLVHHVFIHVVAANVEADENVARAAEMHLGHPRVTVACQSDWALFTLGLNLAKSTSLAARSKVANYSL
jgi:hypothetical protein